ncbi:hypothetical protein HK405_014122, partial [Cladochytrium tenue]
VSSESDLASSLLGIPVAVGIENLAPPPFKRAPSTDLLGLAPSQKSARFATQDQMLTGLKVPNPAAWASLPAQLVAPDFGDTLTMLAVLAPTSTAPASPILSIGDNLSPQRPSSPAAAGRLATAVCPHPGCGAVIRDPKNLEEHMQTHDPARETFPCGLCGKRMARRRDVRRHMLSHGQSGRFRCDECGADMRRKDNLHKHREFACRTRSSSGSSSGGAAEAAGQNSSAE